MQIPLISNRGLAQAIYQARYNLRHPEKFLERWQQKPAMLQAVIETQALHLSMLLELQHRRQLHGPIDCTGFESG